MAMADLVLITAGLLIVFLGNPAPNRTFAQGQAQQENPAVINFRTYLRINSAHPNPKYQGCIDWLRAQAAQLKLDVYYEEFQAPDLFVLRLTWNGTNPALKSILINSHMDVVAVDPTKWTHDPFSAYKDADGNIFGRGAVDMKHSTVAVLEAFRRLRIFNFQPLRTIHMTIMPDEEIGGLHGMKPFVNSQHFRDLNVGFDMDEGSASSDDTLGFSYGQKSIWQFNFTARGKAVHGSYMPPASETAGQKLHIVIDKLLRFRQSQLDLMEAHGLPVENVTSLNLVRLGGGIGDNTVPSEVWASFDMRIRVKPQWGFAEAKIMLDNIAAEAGPDVSYKFIVQGLETGETTPDNSNIWWAELQRTCAQMNVTCKPIFLNGGTDGRYVRNLGIPVFGINPFLRTPKLAHQDNEYMNEKNFLDGIDRFVQIIKNIANVPATPSDRETDLLI